MFKFQKSFLQKIRTQFNAAQLIQCICKTNDCVSSLDIYLQPTDVKSYTNGTTNLPGRMELKDNDHFFHKFCEDHSQ